MSEKQEILQDIKVEVKNKTPWLSTDLLSCEESIVESCSWGWDSWDSGSWSYAEWVYSITVQPDDTPWAIDEKDAVCYREAIQSEDFWDISLFTAGMTSYPRAVIVPLWSDFNAIFYEDWSAYDAIYLSVKKINTTLTFDHIAWATINSYSYSILTWAMVYESDSENWIYKCVMSMGHHFQQDYTQTTLFTIEINVNAWTITTLNTNYLWYDLRGWWPIVFNEPWKLTIIWTYGWTGTIDIVNDVTTFTKWVTIGWFSSWSYGAIDSIIEMTSTRVLVAYTNVITLLDVSWATPTTLHSITHTPTWNSYQRALTRRDSTSALYAIAWWTDDKFYVIDISADTVVAWPEHINYAAEWNYNSAFLWKVSFENYIYYSEWNATWGSQWADMWNILVDWTDITFWNVTEFLPQAEIWSNDRMTAGWRILVNGRLVIMYWNYTAQELRYIIYESVDLTWGYFTTDNWDWTKQNFIWFAMNDNLEYNPITEEWEVIPTEIDTSPLRDNWILSDFTPWEPLFLSGVWWISHTWTVKIWKALNKWMIRIEAN
jgi:hypothetical protein